MREAFLAGRIGLGLYYLLSAFLAFANLNTMAAYAGAQGVPAPVLAVIVAHVLLGLGGVSLVTGYRPTWGVAALALFFVPVTLSMHAFWKETDPMAQMAQFAHFGKNLALLASALMFLAIPQPWPYSVGERRVVRHAEA